MKPRNFKERRRLAMSAEIDPDDLEVKLKDKIESSKHLYDFKYIQKKFKTPQQADQSIYVSKDNLYTAVRDPTI